MDNAGYDCVWLAEHHFNTYSVCPSVTLMGTHIAARTKHLRIGTAVTLAGFYHPLRLAEELAMLDISRAGDSTGARGADSMQPSFVRSKWNRGQPRAPLRMRRDRFEGMARRAVLARRQVLASARHRSVAATVTASESAVLDGGNVARSRYHRGANGPFDSAGSAFVARGHRREASVVHRDAARARLHDRRPRSADCASACDREDPRGSDRYRARRGAMDDRFTPVGAKSTAKIRSKAICGTRSSTARPKRSPTS